MSVASSADEPFLSALQSANPYLYRLERLLLADQAPVGFDTIWLPRLLADKLKDRLHGGFIISSLERYGGFIDYIRYQIEATTTSEVLAATRCVLDAVHHLIAWPATVSGDGVVVTAAIFDHCHHRPSDVGIEDCPVVRRSVPARFNVFAAL
jgi:hypothetical protein